jgi:hypothetical protein
VASCHVYEGKAVRDTEDGVSLEFITPSCLNRGVLACSEESAVIFTQGLDPSDSFLLLVSEVSFEADLEQIDVDLGAFVFLYLDIDLIRF